MDWGPCIYRRFSTLLLTKLLKVYMEWNLKHGCKDEDWGPCIYRRFSTYLLAKQVKACVHGMKWCRWTWILCLKYHAHKKWKSSHLFTLITPGNIVKLSRIRAGVFYKTSVFLSVYLVGLDVKCVTYVKSQDSTPRLLDQVLYAAGQTFLKRCAPNSGWFISSETHYQSGSSWYSSWTWWIYTREYGKQQLFRAHPSVSFPILFN